MRAAVGSGLAAAIGFLLIFAHLRCCEGEAGFDQNASITSLVAAALLLAAIGVQRDWGTRPLLSGIRVVAWSLGILIIMAAAHPSWDHYVHGRDLHIGLRALIVFCVAALHGFVLHRVTSPRIKKNLQP